MRVPAMIRLSAAFTLFALLLAFATTRYATADDSSGWIAAGGGLCSCMNLYSQAGRHQQLKGQLAAQVYSLSAAADGTLYADQVLSDGSTGVASYPPGSRSPTRELDVLGSASAIVVRADGTLYVGTPGGIVFEYPPGATHPSATVLIMDSSLFGGIRSLALDPMTNDVYVDLADLSGHIAFNFLFRVSADLRDVTRLFYVPFENVIRIAVDNQSDLIVGLRNGIGIYPQGQSKPARFFGRGSLATGLAYDSLHDLLYVARDGAYGISVYRYSTGRLVNTITSGWGPSNVPDSIALDPTRP